MPHYHQGTAALAGVRRLQRLVARQALQRVLVCPYRPCPRPVALRIQRRMSTPETNDCFVAASLLGATSAWRRLRPFSDGFFIADQHQRGDHVRPELLNMYFQHSQARTPIGLVARHIHAINNSWSGKRSQSRNSHSDVACAACAFNNICTFAGKTATHNVMSP
jgi:hypothetical protein